MMWKKFQKVIWTLLAVCAGGAVLLFIIGDMGFVLVVGETDSGDIWAVLILVFLLALIAWGDGAIVKFTKGRVRKGALTIALVLEGLFMGIVLFSLAFGDCNTQYIPFQSPGKDNVLVVAEESWLLGGWGRFYWQVFPGLLRDTGVTYYTDDGFRPFKYGACELEWEKDYVTVRFSTGGMGWRSCTVPLD